jgi:hypothetical protein
MAFYQWVPVSASHKQGQENFKQLVRDSTCPIKEFWTKERVEKFSARASAYYDCTYHHIFENKQHRARQQDDTHDDIVVATHHLLGRRPPRTFVLRYPPNAS